MASTSKKRKISEENRSFQEKWTEQYLCIQSGGKALCLVCQETISVLKEYNIKRHYITKHKEYENMTGEARKEKNIILAEISERTTVSVCKES